MLLPVLLKLKLKLNKLLSALPTFNNENLPLFSALPRQQHFREIWNKIILQINHFLRVKALRKAHALRDWTNQQWIAHNNKIAEEFDDLLQKWEEIKEKTNKTKETIGHMVTSILRSLKEKLTQWVDNALRFMRAIIAPITQCFAKLVRLVHVAKLVRLVQTALKFQPKEKMDDVVLTPLIPTVEQPLVIGFARTFSPLLDAKLQAKRATTPLSIPEPRNWLAPRPTWGQVSLCRP